MQCASGLISRKRFNVKRFLLPEHITAHFIKFSIVGALGTLLNLALMALLVEVFATGHIAASAIAIETSIIHNFLLNNFWTFGSRGQSSTLCKRLIHFNLISVGSMVVNVAVSAALIQMDIRYLLAQASGIVAAYAINYLVTAHLVFGGADESKAPFQPELRPDAASWPTCQTDFPDSPDSA